jgi:hypothetical protein
MSDHQLSRDRAIDADLLTRVGIALTLRLQHTLHAVHIQVNGGMVTLRGIVPSFYDRQLAVEVTRRVAGVHKIQDELTVAGQATSEKERRVYTATNPEPTNASRGAGTESTRRSSASYVIQQLRHNRSWRGLFNNAAAVLRSLFLVVAITLAAGCGQGAKDASVAVHPATGKITFKGQSIPGAMLTLHPKTEIADVPKPRASVGKDGAFHVSTFAGGDGAPEGEYTVTVVWYKPIKNGPDVEAGPNVIPKQYTSPQSSNVTVKIAAGQNDLPTIQL